MAEKKVYAVGSKTSLSYRGKVVPSILSELLKDPKKAGPVMEALMKMRKFDIEKLKEVAG